MSRTTKKRAGLCKTHLTRDSASLLYDRLEPSDNYSRLACPDKSQNGLVKFEGFYKVVDKINCLRFSSKRRLEYLSINHYEYSRFYFITPAILLLRLQKEVYSNISFMAYHNRGNYNRDKRNCYVISLLPSTIVPAYPSLR